LVFRAWGGARAGAGRPRLKDSGLPHRKREALARPTPLHVSLSVVDALPSLRSDLLSSIVMRCLRRAREREGFRLIHFSILKRHLHLVVEADSAKALSRGMQSLTISLARRINRALGRRGRVFADRYFARPLRTPTETRAAVAYVLLNHRKHCFERRQYVGAQWIDGLSSGPWFDGWLDAAPRPPPEEEPPVSSPKTWLLRTGWKLRGGLIPVALIPGPRPKRDGRRGGEPARRRSVRRQTPWADCA